MNIRTANSVAEFLIFVFGVDNDNFGANHHGTESFELYGERLSGTRFSEDDEIGVFESKAVEDNKAVIMHIYTIEDTLFLGKIGGSKGETGRDSASVHIPADLELVGTLR